MVVKSLSGHGSVSAYRRIAVVCCGNLTGRAAEGDSNHAYPLQFEPTVEYQLTLPAAWSRQRLLSVHRLHLKTLRGPAWAAAGESVGTEH